MVQQVERPSMKPGEVLVIMLLLICAGGIAVTAFMPGLNAGMISGGTEGETSLVENPSDPVDRLAQGCSALIYGNLPRQSFSGDTTILTMDLDIAAYTVTQANLRMTRLLRDCSITLIETRQRAEGGLTFIATLPDGSPIRMELKAPL